MNHIPWRLKLATIAASLTFIPALSTSAGDDGFAGFEPPVLYDLPSPARSIRAGDLDGDGDVDLVMTHLTGNSVSILFNNGDGTFEPGPNMLVAIGMGDSAITDFDGDGIMDIIAVSQGSPVNGPFDGIGRVAILRGLGGGVFAEPEFYFAGFQPVGVAAGDLDGDGHPDFAVTNQLSNDVAVFLNDGDGTPQEPVFYPVGGNPQRIAVVDMNLNGHPDLVVVNRLDFTLSLLFNDGHGDFPTAQQLSSPFVNNQTLSVRDINGDGFPEVGLAKIAFESMVIHPNDNGVLDDQILVPLELPTNIGGLSPINGDDTVDIAASGRHTKGARLGPMFAVTAIGDGGGSFQDPSEPIALFGNNLPLAQCEADLDNDGDIDVVIVSVDAIVLINKTQTPIAADLTGDGFVNSADLAELLRAWGQPGAADFDKSGAVDGKDLAHLLANWSAAP